MTRIQQMPWFRSIAARCVLGLALACSGASSALAHPDVWVKVKYLLTFGETSVSQITLDWSFDVFFSSQAMNRFDLDRDGVFSEEEARALEAAVFGSPAEEDHFVRVFLGDAAQETRLERFDPRLEGEHLVVRLTFRPEKPIAYRDNWLALATYDDGAYDFTLADDDFLRVDGSFDPSCRFRVETGRGPLSDIPQTIVLSCPE